MLNIGNFLKIIIAVHHFPPTYKGGAEWRAYRTAKWLQSQGHSVQVFCVESVNDTQTNNLRWIDDKYNEVAIRRLFINLKNSPNPEKWEYDNLWIENHFSRFLAEEKPDIFHLISGYLMTAAVIKAAKKLQIPTIATLTDFWFLCPRITLQRTTGELCSENTSLDCVRCNFEKKRRFRLPAQKSPLITNTVWQKTQNIPIISKYKKNIDIRTQTLQAALNRVDVAICPSNFLKETYIKRGFYAKNMQFLRQGLTYSPVEKTTKNTSSNLLRIGYIGQIAPHKGVHTLISAFNKLDAPTKRVELRLYGDINQFPDYHRNLLHMGGQEKIKFEGTFSHQQISQIYEGIDVLVVPSIWYENSPNVILEAFAYKVPVIASNLGGMAELVEDEKTGYLFTPGDADDLAKKLQIIVNTPIVINNLKNNIALPKTLEIEMTELTSIYQTLVSS